MLDKFPKLARLIEDCAPFVERAFRGPRFRRAVVINAALVLLTLLGGLWMSLGSGELEREFRESAGLEVRYYERQEVEFKVIEFDDFMYEYATEERQRILNSNTRPAEGNDFSWLIQQGQRRIALAGDTTAPPEYAELAARAAALEYRYPFSGDVHEYGRTIFDWTDEREVSALRAAVDADLVPYVERYRSPLGFADAIRITGLIAGFLGAGLLLFMGPLIGGVTLAQEAHANTLQPLLGTRLTARALVLGFTSGSMALATFLAAPLLLIFLIAALTLGHPVAGLGFICIAVATTAATTLLTQMMGLAMGRRWAAGLVGITLTGALGTALLTAIGLGWSLRGDAGMTITLLPHVGVVHLLRETFFPASRLNMFDAGLVDARLMFATVAYGSIAFLLARALERRVAGRTQPSLLRAEGLFAAGIVSALALLTMPRFNHNDQIEIYFLSLGLALFPLAAILAGRVVVGDGPSTLRTLPIKSLLLEFGGYILLHAVMTLAVLGGIQGFSMIGSLCLAWALLVVALVSIRAVAVPCGIPGILFCLFSLGAAAVQFGMAAACFAAAAHGYVRADIPTAFFELSVLLGLGHLLVLGAVPTLLLRALSRGSAGLR